MFHTPLSLYGTILGSLFSILLMVRKNICFFFMRYGDQRFIYINSTLVIFPYIMPFNFVISWGIRSSNIWALLCHLSIICTRLIYYVCCPEKDCEDIWYVGTPLESITSLFFVRTICEFDLLNFSYLLVSNDILTWSPNHNFIGSTWPNHTLFPIKLKIVYRS